MTFDEWWEDLLRRAAFQAGAVSRDAEIAKWKAIAANKADQVDAAKEVIAEVKEERNQLRDQVKMLREVVNDALSGMREGYAIWSPRAQEVLASTEPKK